jgi:hypothetical protein
MLKCRMEPRAPMGGTSDRGKKSRELTEMDLGKHDGPKEDVGEEKRMRGMPRGDRPGGG